MQLLPSLFSMSPVRAFSHISQFLVELPPVPAPQPTITPLIEHLRAVKNSNGHAKTSVRSAASTSTEEARRSAALASVSKAATRRGPTLPSGPMMIAGKGRDVTITPTSSAEVEGAASGVGKQKGGGKDRVSPARGSQTPVVVQKSDPLVSSASTPFRESRAQSPGGSVDGRGGGRGRGERGRVGRGRGARGRVGRGVGSGGMDRTAQGAVLQILTSNSDAERGKTGRSRDGRGRGSGGGQRGITTSNAGASEARIDM